MPGSVRRARASRPAWVSLWRTWVRWTRRYWDWCSAFGPQTSRRSWRWVTTLPGFKARTRRSEYSMGVRWISVSPTLTVRATKSIRSGLARTTRLLPRLGEAVEEVFTAEVEFAIDQCGAGAEGVVEMIHGQRGVFAVVAQNHRRAVPASDIDATGCPNGRRKDKIADAIESERFAARLA